MSDSTIMQKRIKELRNSLELNQDKFAEKVGCAVDTIRKIEQGTRKLSLDIAMLIAEKCDVSLGWLCGLEDTNSQSYILDSFRSFFSLGERVIVVENKDIRSENTFLTIRLSEATSDYFLAINEIEKTKREKDLPEAAYIAWVESVKATYIKKVEGNQAGEVKEFVLVENTDNFGEDVTYTQKRRTLPDLAAKIQFDKLNLDKT